MLNKYLRLSALLLFNTAVFAGGPLVLEGPAGNTPATYQIPVIGFNTESGDLGTIATNAQANLLVDNALNLWNGLGDSTLNLSRGADIPTNININNFTSWIPDPNDGSVHNDDDGLNPIVYDYDGSIIDAFFGIGQSANVVGFASSSIFIGASFFTEGFAVINGNDLGLSDIRLTLIIAHEIGHMIGLDHSQADIDYTESLNDGCPSGSDSYPLMYPYACRTKTLLHSDDKLAVSTLYPAADFAQNRGQFKGRFQTTAGAPILGANLWIEDSSTGDIYSIVSDYLAQGTGFFSLMLPAGTYMLHANPVNSEFFEGSSVGPYSLEMTDLSFQSPAKDIANVDFVADGMTIALVGVSAGEATDITFAADGSGSFTTGNAIIDPVPVNPVVGGSDSGSLSLPLLLTLLLLSAVRGKVAGSRIR